MEIHLVDAIDVLGIPGHFEHAAAEAPQLLEHGLIGRPGNAQRQRGKISGAAGQMIHGVFGQFHRLHLVGADEGLADGVPGGDGRIGALVYPVHALTD